MQNIQTYYKTVKARMAVIFFIALSFSAKAQVDSGFVSNPLASMPKVIIQLNNGNTVKGNVVRITDSTITLDIQAQADRQNAATYADTSMYSNFYILHTEDISYVKVKRNAFLSGFAIGGLVGYGLGYGVGYISHKDDDTKDYEQNKQDAKARGTGVGIVGAASLGLVGGAIAPVLMRKKFIIDGKRANMQKLIKVVMNVL